uniref:Uncharacterized protein n=1 Tax=Avena sativa TaxID=4498 RepID=A0ACD5ZVC3_AVESA
MNSSGIGKLLTSIYKLVVRHFVFITTMLITAATVFGAASFRAHEILQPVHIFLATFLPASTVIIYFLSQQPKVYLVDYACFSGSHHCRRAPTATFIEHARHIPMYNERSIRFFTRLLQQSGLGEETYLPQSIAYIQPFKYCTFEAGREEAKLVVFSTIDSLFSKRSITPQAIDILVVNCSVFNPTPSFPDMIINKYKMRNNIHSVHLSGMGCSAGLVSIELARNLLQVAAPGTRALVVSTEILTPNYYPGNERAMLLPYCLFRMGGAAMLLSTSPANARFRLRSIVRTLTAADNSSYRCIHQEEDDKGNRGMNLSIDLLLVASTTLKANIVAIAPLVLPVSEQLYFALSFIRKKMTNQKYKLYVPDFKTAFEHFCIHAGGRAVIDGVQRSLGLSDVHVEPSRMTLHRFGNTSSSSPWYELAYIEAKGRMNMGDRVWMIGFGSGFKCNSVVLECIAPTHNTDGPWAGCIQRYPVEVKSFEK